MQAVFLRVWVPLVELDSNIASTDYFQVLNRALLDKEADGRGTNRNLKMVSDVGCPKISFKFILPKKPFSRAKTQFHRHVERIYRPIGTKYSLPVGVEALVGEI